MFTGRDICNLQSYSELWISYTNIIQQSLDALLTVGNGRRTACAHKVDDLLAEFIIGRLQTFEESTPGRIADGMDIVEELYLVNIQTEGHLRWCHQCFRALRYLVQQVG